MKSFSMAHTGSEKVKTINYYKIVMVFLWKTLIKFVSRLCNVKKSDAEYLTKFI